METPIWRRQWTVCSLKKKVLAQHHGEMVLKQLISQLFLTDFAKANRIPFRSASCGSHQHILVLIKWPTILLLYETHQGGAQERRLYNCFPINVLPMCVTSGFILYFILLVEVSKFVAYPRARGQCMQPDTHTNIHCSQSSFYHLLAQWLPDFQDLSTFAFWFKPQ